MIEEISKHGVFDTLQEADEHRNRLNALEGSDNLTYAVKVVGDKWEVVLLAGFEDYLEDDDFLQRIANMDTSYINNESIWESY